jgi:hypothetical protein
MSTQIVNITKDFGRVFAGDVIPLVRKAPGADDASDRDLQANDPVGLGLRDGFGLKAPAAGVFLTRGAGAADGQFAPVHLHRTHPSSALRTPLGHGIHDLAFHLPTV